MDIIPHSVSTIICPPAASKTTHIFVYLHPSVSVPVSAASLLAINLLPSRRRDITVNLLEYIHFE